MKFLHQKGGDFNCKKARSGYAPIHVACQEDNSNIVEYLLSQNIDPELDTTTRMKPLHIAAGGGSLDCISCLLSHKVLVDSTDMSGRTPLVFAIHNGHTEAAKLLLQAGADINKPDSMMTTPLHFGIRSKRHQAVKFLLENGAKCETPTTDAMYPIHEAAAAVSPECILLLKEHGCNLELSGKNGWTPLHFAASKKRPDAISVLLELGVDKNGKGTVGATALHVAASMGLLSNVQTLLSKGAEWLVTDDRNYTPWGVAALRENKEVAILMYEWENESKEQIELKTSRILNQTGDLYSFGEGTEGQLGHGQFENAPTPRKVESLAGQKVFNVSLGKSHSVCQLLNGEIMVWGSGKNGKLGLGYKQNINLPTVLTLQPKGLKIAHISCGSQHVLALGHQGEQSSVYSWGENSFGQLGSGDTNDCVFPRKVDLFQSKHIRSLACGKFSSFFLSATGQVWACGSNHRGQ